MTFHDVELSEVMKSKNCHCWDSRSMRDAHEAGFERGAEIALCHFKGRITELESRLSQCVEGLDHIMVHYEKNPMHDHNWAYYAKEVAREVSGRVRQ